MKTSDQMYNDMIARAKRVSPNIHWVPMAPQTDVLVTPINEILRIEGLTEYTNAISSLDRYKKFISDTTKMQQVADAVGISLSALKEQLSSDLDSRIGEWGITRKLATQAIGSIRLAFASPSTINVAINAKLTTLNNINYLTTEVLAGTPVPMDNNYVIYVMAEAEKAGSAYNVPENTYFRSSDIQGLVEAIATYEIINGQDKETDLEFIDRFIKIRKQEGVGSKSWLLRTVLTVPTIVDANVYGPGDEHFDRDYGADVWVYSLEVPLTVLEPIMKVNSKHILLKAPLTDNPIFAGVLLKANRVPDYTVIDSWYKRSIYDVVEIVPSTPTQTYVEYTIDKNMQDAQAILRNPENWILGAFDLVLIRKAYRINLDFSMNVHFNDDLTDAEIETSIQNITSDLGIFFSGGTASDGTTYTRKKLGVQIDWSDCLGVVLKVQGVDRVEEDSFDIFIDGVEQADPVEISYDSYALCGNVTIVQV